MNGTDWRIVEREQWNAYVAQHRTCQHCQNSAPTSNTAELAGRIICLACLKRATDRIGTAEWNAYAAALAAR